MNTLLKRRHALEYAKRVVTTYGLSVEGQGLYADELEVCTPEACFVIEDDGVTHVIMWTGSYPFANDHPMGAYPSIEEAARYAIWLLKREQFYSDRDERLCDEAYQALKDRLVEQGCDGCDQDPWTEPVHYGSCPLALKDEIRIRNFEELDEAAKKLGLSGFEEVL